MYTTITALYRSTDVKDFLLASSCNMRVYMNLLGKLRDLATYTGFRVQGFRGFGCGVLTFEPNV